MTHVSRKKLNPKVDRFLDKLVSSTYSNIEPTEMMKALNIALSETEIDMVKKRLGIMLLLDIGINNETIEETLNVTRQTIIRIRTNLKLIPEDNKARLISKLRKIYLKEIAKSYLKNLDISRTEFRKKAKTF